MFGFIRRRLDTAKFVKQMQALLQDRFGERGLNFMTLYPTIHRCVLRDALVMNTVINLEEAGDLARTDHPSLDELIDGYIDMIASAQKVGTIDNAIAHCSKRLVEIEPGWQSFLKLESSRP